MRTLSGTLTAHQKAPFGTPYVRVEIDRIVDPGKFAFIGSGHADLDNSETDYGAIEGGHNPGGAYAEYELLFHTAGKLKNFYVYITVEPISGRKWTFTVIHNAVAADLEVVIADTDTSGSDTVNEVTVAAYDEAAVRIVPTSSPGAAQTTYATWICQFVPDNKNLSVHFVNGWTTVAQQTVYVPIAGGIRGGTATEAPAKRLCPVNGKFTALYYNATGGTQAGHRSITTLRKNGANTALTKTVSYGDATQGCIEADVEISAGDLVDVYCDQNTGLNASFEVSLIFEPDLLNRTVVISGDGGEALSDTDTKYHTLYEGNGSGYFASTYRSKVPSCSVEHFYVEISAAPGAGKSYTFTIQKNGVDTGLEVVIADSDTTGNDTSTRVTCEQGDELGLKVVPSGTPTSGVLAYWGCLLEMTV